MPSDEFDARLREAKATVCQLKKLLNTAKDADAASGKLEFREVEVRLEQFRAVVSDARARVLSAELSFLRFVARLQDQFNAIPAAATGAPVVGSSKTRKLCPSAAASEVVVAAPERVVAMERPAAIMEPSAVTKQLTAGTKQHSAGTKERSAVTKEHSTVTKEPSAGTKQHSAGTKERSAVTKEHSAVTKEHSTVTKEPSAGTKQHSAGTKERSAVTKEHSTVTKEPSAGTKQHSAGTKERSAVTKEHSAVTKEPSAGTKQHSAGTKERSAVTKEHSAVTKEHSTVTKEPSAGTKQHSAGTKERSAVTKEHSTVTKEPSAVTTIKRPAVITERSHAITEHPAKIKKRRRVVSLERPAATTECPGANMERPDAIMKRPAATVQRPAETAAVKPTEKNSSSNHKHRDLENQAAVTSTTYKPKKHKTSGKPKSSSHNDTSSTSLEKKEKERKAKKSNKKDHERKNKHHSLKHDSLKPAPEKERLIIKISKDRLTSNKHIIVGLETVSHESIGVTKASDLQNSNKHVTNIGKGLQMVLSENISNKHISDGLQTVSHESIGVTTVSDLQSSTNNGNGLQMVPSGVENDKESPKSPQAGDMYPETAKSSKRGSSRLSKIIPELASDITLDFKQAQETCQQLMRESGVVRRLNMREDPDDAGSSVGTQLAFARDYYAASRLNSPYGTASRSTLLISPNHSVATQLAFEHHAASRWNSPYGTASRSTSPISPDDYYKHKLLDEQTQAEINLLFGQVMREKECKMQLLAMAAKSEPEPLSFSEMETLIYCPRCGDLGVHDCVESPINNNEWGNDMQFF